MVILTNSSVEKPLDVYDRYDARSEIENGLFIIYEHTDIMDRLFKEKTERLKSEAFDYKITSIRILGKESLKKCL